VMFRFTGAMLLMGQAEPLIDNDRRLHEID
jgi:hypothetical protein